MRPATILPLLLVLLAACGRPVTEAEAGFLDTLHGPSLNARAVRLVDGVLIGNISHWRPARPQVACRERIFPAPGADAVRTSTAALVLYQTGFFRRDLYGRDFLDGWPERLPLAHAMLFAHEMTHVWQWQNRALTGYSPLRAANEHVPGGDPYLFDITRARAFLDYSDEQQGALVEEFVCCRALDPGGARTRRLYDILRPVFPAIAAQSPVPRANVALPWAGAETEGICS